MGSGSNEVDELRRQVDESRENLGEAVGALAYKADVKNRGQEAISDKKEAVMEKVEELKSKVSGGGALSPRGDWRAPSDASPDVWLAELKASVPTR